MKHILSIFAFLVFAASAQASEISACSEDELQSIQDDVDDYANSNDGSPVQILLMSNVKGAITGVFFGEVDGKFFSATLCGRNPGYFYLDMTLEDVREGRIVMYSDEYDTEVENFGVNKKTYEASFDLSIRPANEEGEPDYEPFTQEVWLTLTPVFEIPL